MIRDLITPGLGFTPGSVEYIITRGLDSAAVVAQTPVFTWQVDNREKVWDVVNRPKKWLVVNNG